MGQLLVMWYKNSLRISKLGWLIMKICTCTKTHNNLHIKFSFCLYTKYKKTWVISKNQKDIYAFNSTVNKMDFQIFHSHLTNRSFVQKDNQYNTTKKSFVVERSNRGMNAIKKLDNKMEHNSITTEHTHKWSTSKYSNLSNRELKRKKLDQCQFSLIRDK